MVATGDDPEKETPDENMNTKKVQIKQEPKNIDDTNNPYNLPNFKPVPKRLMSINCKYYLPKTKQ